MTNRILMATAAMLALSLPMAAHAQSGATGGAVSGAIGGAIIGGPVGALVGAVGGAVVGGIATEEYPRFRTYAVAQKRPSYQYTSEVRIGAELPATGIEYYEVPAQYGVKEYRYTVVNDRMVLVDPRTRRIVQIIE